MPHPISKSPKNIKPEKSLAFSVYLFAVAAPVSIVLAQIAAGLVILSGIACMASRSEKVGLHLWGSILMPPFLALVLLSSVFSHDLLAAVPQLKKSWVMICFFPMVAFSSAFSSRKLIDLLILGTGIASLLGLFRFITGAVERAAPFSGGYTTMALFEAAMMPFAIAFFAEERSSKRWFYLSAGVVMAAGLIFSGTRAGWFAAMVGILIVGSFLNKKRTAIGLLIAVVLLAAIPQSRALISERFRVDKEGGITSGRASLYMASLEPISHLPFLGYGPGSFRRLVSVSILEETGDPGIQSWHSTPLEVLIESGPLALILFLGLALRPLLMCWRNRANAPGDGIFWMAILSSLVCLYLAGLTTNLLRDFMLLSLLTIIWSVSVGGSGRLAQSEKQFGH
jgi:O-antigen ligase